MNENYSNREIDSHFANVNDNIGEIKVLVVDLNTKVGIQNGRVVKLESRAAWMAGVGATAVFLFGIILSLIVYSFQLSQENLKQSIFLEINSKNRPLTQEEIEARAAELQAQAKVLQIEIEKKNENPSTN